MRLGAALSIASLSCACGARPDATRPLGSAPPASEAASTPGDPVAMEAQLRAALGHDPRPVCAARVSLRLTGDANVQGALSPATVSDDELRTLEGFFPALGPRDEIDCRAATRLCHVTIDPQAEFPRAIAYSFDAQSPPRVVAITAQIVRGP